MRGDIKRMKDRVIECKKQFYHKNRLNFILATISQIAFSIIGLAISFLMMITIEAIEYQDTKRVWMAGILCATILVGYVVFGFLQKVYTNRYLKNGLSNFKNYIFQNILRKSIREYRNSSTGQIINAFSNDLSSIETNYLSGTVQMIQQIVIFIIAMCCMFYLNWILALCILASCVIPMTVSLIFGRNLDVKERKTSDEGEGFVDQVKDLLSGFTLIKSFQAEQEVLCLFKEKNISLEEAKRDRRETNDMVRLASMFSSILVISMIFIIGLVLAWKGVLTIGAVIAFVELSHYVTTPIEKIFPLIKNRQAVNALFGKISEAIASKEETTESCVPITGFSQAIEFKNVSFGYDKEKQVLSNINLTFQPGKSYALVGSSGCGKSTLTQLLIGYYNDYQGEIDIDNKLLSTISLDSLYDVISVISQDVFLFDSSIYNNVMMFKEFDETKVKRAVKMAGLERLVEEKGMDYACGVGGVNLSGGEKQRVSIARCLLRETPVIIMDEATAALDSRTAYEVESAILDIEKVTKIIVTHRYHEDLLRRYDQIFVLRDGKIVEQGDFDTLMNLKQYFYSLYHVSAGEKQEDFDQL